MFFDAHGEITELQYDRILHQPEELFSAAVVNGWYGFLSFVMVQRSLPGIPDTVQLLYDEGVRVAIDKSHPLGGMRLGSLVVIRPYVFKGLFRVASIRTGYHP